MIVYVAGHGHTFEKDIPFCEWMKKHQSHFLVSFAYPDMGRLRHAKAVRMKQQKARKGKQTNGKTV